VILFFSCFVVLDQGPQTHGPTGRMCPKRAFCAARDVFWEFWNN